MSGFRRSLQSILPTRLSCSTTQRQRLTYEVSSKVYTERLAALHFMAARLQARAVDAAPKYGAPQRDEEEQIARRVVNNRLCSKLCTSRPKKLVANTLLGLHTTHIRTLRQHDSHCSRMDLCYLNMWFLYHWRSYSMSVRGHRRSSLGV